MDTGPYALMAELLDSLNVGLCLFDAGDHALVWNRTFLALFPEHDGHIRVGEHYSDNLRRFYQQRLDAAELPMIDRYIAEGIARHRSQSQPFVFAHRGQWVRVASLPIGGPHAPQGRLRVWTPLVAPTGGMQWERPTVGQSAGTDDAFLEHVADGIMVLDNQGLITAINEQALFLYGLAHKADAIGLRYEELLHRVWTGDADRVSATLIERQRFPGAPFEVELPNGRWLRVIEQRGVEGRSFSSHVDISDLKRLQRAADAARAEADRANAAKSHFLAMISHEIRTPMNAIIGIGRIALHAAQDPAQRGYLETINTSAGRLLGIINDLLDFSKIEAGKVDIVHQPFALDEALEPLCDLILGSPGNDQVEITVRIRPGTPDRLVGDPLRLSQILANLTSNALKFTERGDILIEVEEITRDGERVDLRFSVADTGIGIHPDQQAALFQPFVQADGSITRRYGGTGLGLSICKQLADLMGGRIGVASVPGQGSRFSLEVTLGLAPADAAPAPLAALPPARVLVVDDHPAARTALVEMVGALGCEVTAVNSGPAALLAVDQAARQNAPIHAVLLDSVMPGWDGALTAERLRTSRRAAGVRVIPMIAANARHSGAWPSHGTGQTDVLFKPVVPSRLRTRLVEVLRQHTPPDTPPHPAPSPRPVAARLRGARLLLVDDNALNREVALHILADTQASVDIAEDGVQAVERVCSGDYDLVLMDIQMPEMDGLEATRRIRRIERFRALPIVAMTAHAMADHRLASRDAGMNEHLTKPIDPDLLIDTLLRLIDPVRLAARRSGGTTSHHAAAPTTAPPPAPEDSAAASETAEQARRIGLDWDAALRRVDDDTATLEKLIRGFCKDTARYPADLRAAAADEDADRIRFLSHALRSSAAYIGAMALSGLAGRTDETARAGHRPLAVGLATELADELEHLLSALPALYSAPELATGGGDADLEPGLLRLAALLENADLRAEDAWTELRKTLPPAHREFAEAVTALLDDLRYAEALDRVRAFTADHRRTSTVTPRGTA
ncbi:hybrid sensor histidine kinase/response regulator [Azospirillum griseum]|uniref:histidine kinase n=1 Tax=Azospirillum griseum TaxID=2496639 RepID=A0A3S0I3A1_9PROT|nr:response regulator [Azospirillum griseum]RTR23091.1 response regulator [Azospirillum griseum]